MHRCKRVLALSALALGYVVVGAPSRAAAQQADASSTMSPSDSAAKDSVAKDSVKKAKAAECTKANQAMEALVQKKVQEWEAQPKDSTKPKNSVQLTLGPKDLPDGVNIQTLMRCMQGGAQPPRMAPKPSQPSAGQPAATPPDSGKGNPPKKD